MASVTCSLNITIPSTVTVLWTYNNNVIPVQPPPPGNTTTLIIRNFQPSDAGVYECVFNDGLGSRWALRRKIRVKGKCIYEANDIYLGCYDVTKQCYCYVTNATYVWCCHDIEMSYITCHVSLVTI